MNSSASETTFVLATAEQAYAESIASISSKLQEFDVVNIDVSDVRYLDFSELDLLIFAKKESVLRGKKLFIVGHNMVVEEMVDIFQLRSYFGYSFDSKLPHQETTETVAANR